MDMEELWSKTREVLRAEVNAVVYNSLLGSNNLVPALLDGDTLVLRVVMDNLKLLITNQWYSTIVRALSQVAGHQMDVEILTQEEIEARPQLKQKAVEEQETVLESSVALNPKYTFETFVVGSGNRFAHAAGESEHISDAGDKLSWAKRLWNVIVGAQIEARNGAELVA